jgi:hypothetical protein
VTEPAPKFESFKVNDLGPPVKTELAVPMVPTRLAPAAVLARSPLPMLLTVIVAVPVLPTRTLSADDAATEAIGATALAVTIKFALEVCPAKVSDAVKVLEYEPADNDEKKNVGISVTVCELAVIDLLVGVTANPFDVAGETVRVEFDPLALPPVTVMISLPEILPAVPKTK